MQLWMFIVTILINDCVYSSFNWVKFEKLHSIVVKYTPRQSRTEAIVLFCFYQSIKPEINGVMVCIPVGQFCQFLSFLIILYWSNVNTSARNHVSIILLPCLLLKSKRKCCYLFIQLQL